MALGGLRPVVALYSTFMSRAWDQVVYDVALHKLPVIFCLDRAGITGDDGPSHHGVYDMALLSKVPGMRVLAPSSVQELHQMLHDAVALSESGPVVVRYPKGVARTVDESEVGTGLQARVAFEPSQSAEVCILAVGKLLGNAIKAATILSESGTPTKVWDVRSCAPLDPAMIADASKFKIVVTVEDGIRDGGIGMAIEDSIMNVAGTAARVHVLGVPTTFIAHNKPDRILASLGLDADGIVTTVRSLIA
jgi:1-deoxy-D-xylulose-5-phosphate synthase